MGRRIINLKNVCEIQFRDATYYAGLSRDSSGLWRKFTIGSGIDYFSDEEVIEFVSSDKSLMFNDDRTRILNRPKVVCIMNNGKTFTQYYDTYDDALEAADEIYGEWKHMVIDED